MKILIIQDHLRSGGTERQSVLLANAFAAAGHATTLLTFRPGGALVPTVARAVDRVCLQPFDWRVDWAAPGLGAAAARLAPAVVLCMGRLANCYAASLAARVPNAAVIGTMRTGKPLPWLYRRALRQVRHVVANSADARDTLVARYGLPADQVSVIHNALVFPEAVARDPALRERHGAGPGTTVMVSVAMFRPEKNQRALIEIAAGLPASLDWQLWFAGDGPTLAACAQLVAEKQLGSRIKFLGFLRDPAPLYAAADLAVHASASEALSNFLIEAQAHGLPAVAFAAQGIGECFVPGRTGWIISPGDHQAFRATLSRRISEPAQARRERAEDARRFARQQFDPARQVAAYLDLFTRLRSRP